MSVNEIVTNKVYRTLKSIDGAGVKTWNKIAFWTKASQVEMANGANLEDELEKTYLNKNVSLWVSPTGSDITGAIGFSSKPFATINKALSLIPKNLNGYGVFIYLNAGTYNESVVIQGMSGRFNFVFPSEGEVVINGRFEFSICSFVGLYSSSGTGKLTINNTTNVNGGFHAYRNTGIFIANMLITINGDSTVYGMKAESGTTITGTGFSLIVNNCSVGFMISNRSSVYVSNLSGSGNIKGVEVSSSIFSSAVNNIAATTPISVLAGSINTSDLAMNSQITALDAKIGAKVIVSATAPTDTTAVWIY